MCCSTGSKLDCPFAGPQAVLLLTTWGQLMSPQDCLLTSMARLQTAQSQTRPLKEENSGAWRRTEPQQLCPGEAGRLTLFLGSLCLH